MLFTLLLSLVLDINQSTLFLSDFCEGGSLLDQFGIPAFIVLLVLEEFADLKAGQLAADVVLDLHGVKKLEASDRLLNEGSQFKIVHQVHSLFLNIITSLKVIFMSKAGYQPNSRSVLIHKKGFNHNLTTY